MHLCLCVGRQQRAQEECGPLCLLLLNVSFPLNLLLQNAVKHLEAACVWVQTKSLSVHLEGEENGSPGGSLL